MQIIPAIDIIGGKAVRLTKGDFQQKKIYDDDPVHLAKSFAEAGFERLHLVDLDGAKSGHIQNIKILESISNQTNLKIDFGGGVRTLDDVRSVLQAGADQCTVGSIAAREPALFEEWIRHFGPEKFFVGADVLDDTIRVAGWTQDSKLKLHDFLQRMISLRIQEFFCTDISKDGAMQGPSTQLYKKILRAFPEMQLIASGGVTTTRDLRELAHAGCKGAIIGKAIYEGLISLEELSTLNTAC